MKTNRMITAGSIVLALMATNAAGQNSNWTNSSGGFWNDSLNWDALIPLNPSQDATLGLAGAYIVDLDTNPDIGILSITNPMATLRVPLGRTLGLNGPTATNNGRITVNHNGSSSNAFISINADTVLGGSGEVWLQTSSDNAQIAGAGTLTNSLGHTIRGVGRITAPMVNNGAVAADSSIAISGNDLDLMSAVTNNSMISAEAGSNLDIVGVTIDQTGGGGLFSANSGNINTVGTGSTIIGGTIDRTGTGEFNLAGTATLTGVTNNGFIDLRLGSTMLVAGTGLTNNGTVVLNRTGSSANSIMNFTASGNLDGTGEVQMQTSTDNSQLNADIGMTITHAATHTIRGVGQVNAAMINNGTISADAAIALSGSALELQINDKINNGDMTAEAGSILQIDGITIDQLAGGDLISNGGDINLNSATIEGGTYSAPGGGQLRADSGTELLSGVTLNGPMRVDLGTTVQVDGDGITNNGVMQINPDNSSANSILTFTADAALGGTGEIQLLSGTDNSQVNTAAGTIVTQAATHLIRGVGQVNAAMINNGEIRADATISFFGSDLDLRTNNKVNNNLMVAAMSSNLDINGIMIDQSGGGMLVADEGEIRLNGATIEGGDYLAIGAGLLRSDTGTQLLSGVTLNGPMRVDLGTTVQVDADGLTNNGIMQLNPDNSSSNSILLFTADAALGGTGEIQMRTGSDNSQINTDPTFTMTQASTHTIRGVGQINAAMVNNGTIRADVAVTLSGSSLDLRMNDKTNAGVMSAESGSVLHITGISLTQTGAGELQANDGEVRLTSATLSGGTIEGTGTGTYSCNALTTFQGVTANADGNINFGSTLTILGPVFNNNGLLRANPINSSADGIIAFPADGALNTTGGGEINLFATGLNSQIDGPGIVTNGPGHTISGNGTIDTELVNSGILSPGNGAIGTLNASGDVTFTSSGSMTIEIGDAGASDRLAVSGTANLAGTLDVVLASGFTPTLAIDYTILTAGSVNGTFDTENLIIDGNLITRVLYEPTQVRLVTRCIADVNLDGTVDPSDFSAWIAAFNAGSVLADQNLDGNVSPADFAAWIANFNAGCP